jgi:SnoaL-like protein
MLRQADKANSRGETPGPARTAVPTPVHSVPRGGRSGLSELSRLSRLLPLLGLLACGTPPTPSAGSDAALADTLKARIEAAYDFSRPGVVERMNSLYPDTGRVISASGGHLIASADSLREGIASFWKNVGTNMRNPKWVWGDVYVDRLGPDAAALTATWSIPHVAPDGHPHVIQGAWTAVFRRMSGKWLIVMEHLSTPPS